MLSIEGLTVRIAGRVLIEDSSVSVPAGHKIGLIGLNGSGKSTLLKVLRGELPADRGGFRIPKAWRIGSVAQEAPAGPTPLLETVLAADTERAALLAELEADPAPERIGEIHARLNEIEAHSAPARAARILAGLGFDGAALDQPVGALSGGWRMRVALAAALFAQPELLLLDEPTNHLDLEATLWLTGYLQRYPHTLLLVSHDRSLLNSVPDGILALEHQKLTLWPGNYDTYERQSRLAAEQAEKAAAQQAKHRAHLQSFIDRFRYKASKASQAQSRVKALERLQSIDLPPPPPERRFDFPAPAELPSPLATFDNVTVGYGDKPILSRLNLRLDADDRIALLGANGQGKSTFAKLLAGRLAPMKGDVHRSSRLSIGYFAQHQTEELDMAATPLLSAQRLMPNVAPEKVRAHLGRFGFAQERSETPVGSLSGGEKARLLLALMARTAPNILILDEPTNHLDIQSREALVEALNDYPGAVVLITHEPWLIELCADRLWLVDGGTVRPYDEDMDAYRKLVLSRQGGAQKDDKGEADAESRRDQRRQAAEKRASLAPLRQKAQTAEKQVEKLATAKAKVEAKLADPKLYEKPGGEVAKLQLELAAAARALAEAEEAWLGAMAEYEEAQAEA